MSAPEPLLSVQGSVLPQALAEAGSRDAVSQLPLCAPGEGRAAAPGKACGGFCWARICSEKHSEQLQRECRWKSWTAPVSLALNSHCGYLCLVGVL